MDLQPIKVGVGETFAVRLSSAPSTGYLWEVGGLPVAIELAGAAHGAASAPGGAAASVFNFVAHREGRYTIRFELKRRWERSALDSALLSIEVG